ncbi:hypothetical protein EV356DRAFT_507364 [Viridothelium virens]|uniref:Zn(2)-C6 fungal-type domain-containing protein n=1 Tax=Viridothelium virens TaxID=1048519 RepID=A0A6A6HJG2_VIRVR|nr:hypothetical protein EV356DRAFT_507364 [Viridothelium virens]
MQRPGSRTQYFHGTGSPRTGSTTNKLRDSCHACALSKVKCAKEKPTCARCAKRGIECEYFITKRPGRKRENRQANNNGKTRDTTKTHTTSSESNDYLTPPDHDPSSARPGSSSGAECYGSLTPLEPSLASVLEGINNDFDDFLTSPVDSFDLEPFDPNDSTPGPNEVAKLLLSGATDPDPISETSMNGHLNTYNTSLHSLTSQSLLDSNTGVGEASDSTCRCLMQALDLMKKLSSTKTSCGVQSNRPGTAGVPSAETIVLENKQTLEAITDMLRCSCAEDSYLLTFLSMIIFKILGRYAAAAPKQQGEEIEEVNKHNGNTSTRRQPRPAGSHSLGEDGVRRMSAQLILSELHRVQNCVNQLSPRLNSGEMGEVSSKRLRSPDREVPGRERSCFPLANDDTSVTPFPTTVLDHLGIGLRQSLSMLSSYIIDVLRQS